MTSIRRAQIRLALAVVLLCAPGSVSATTFFNITGPPKDNIDGDAGAGLEVSLNSHVGGRISTDPDEFGITVSLTTTAVYADNLQIFLVHDGVEVELYRGEGDTEGSQILATFSMDAEDPAPPTGSANGAFLPVGDLDLFRGQDVSGIWTLRIVDALGEQQMTDLDTWTLSVNVQTVNPSRSVALFFDPAFVDTVDESDNGIGDAEALNIRELLLSFGHDVETFTGTSASSFANALVGKDLLIIPELEGPDLNGRDLLAALSEPARDEIRGFVSGGGDFMTNSSVWGDNGVLVQGLFGYGVESVDNASATLLDAATGSPYQGGPGVVSTVSVTRGLQELPPEATQFYEGPLLTGVAHTVVSYPFPLDGSGGKVIWLGNDYFNSPPLGFSDDGWVATMNRTVVDDLAPFFKSQRVALFNDPDYVDDVNDAANLESSLVALGHSVVPFTGTSRAEMQAALANADVIVIPDPEVADPTADFADSGADDEIVSFVSAGGVAILHAATSETLLESLLALDPLFTGDNAVDVTPSTASFAIGTGVGGTVFETPVAFLDLNTTTDAFSDLPDRGANVPFSIGATGALVAMFRVGAGNLFWLGWDWEDAAADGGWVDTLGRAVSAAGPNPVPEAGGAVTGLAALAVLALARRRRH